jgi:hypothetical protein
MIDISWPGDIMSILMLKLTSNRCLVARIGLVLMLSGGNQLTSYKPRQCLTTRF